jgi:hypothetical protein
LCINIKVKFTHHDPRSRVRKASLSSPQPLHGINLFKSLDPQRLSLSFRLYDVPKELESLADKLS